MQNFHKWKAFSTFPVLERKGKGRKLRLLSVRIRRFAGRYEPRLISLQAFGSGLCKASRFAGGYGTFFY